MTLTLNGTGVSKGIARGRAFVLTCGNRPAAPRRSIQASEIGREVDRYDAAVSVAGSQLAALRADLGARMGPTQSDILAAQTALINDAGLRDQVFALVRKERLNIEAALAQVIDGYSRAIGGVADSYLRERAADVRDVGRRLLSALVGGPHPSPLVIPESAIVVSEELLPSVTARLQLENVKAFVTERGNRFSHSSILARSTGTPAVVGVADAAQRIKTGNELIVDGLAGVVFVEPDASVRREYERQAAEVSAYRYVLGESVDRPSATLEDETIPLLANVNNLADTEAAVLCRAEGIGLYRTEFQFSARDSFPTEDEQYEVLLRAAERFAPRQVVFRVLDLGGDKTLAYFPLPPSRNPSLAQRGIRLLLHHPDVLKPQLRAFLRVSANHPISILLPVVGSLDEVREARAVLRQVQRELAAVGRRFSPTVPVGAMIEVPSAALTASFLAKEVDFFSLGTNDLVQYVLAADREDEGAAGYYEPLHPAVLRLIRSVAEAAAGAERELTICGEIAGDPGMTALLLGLGLRRFSVAPGQLLEVKDAIRRTSLREAEGLAGRALNLGSAAEIEALLEESSPSGAVPDADLSPVSGPDPPGAL